MEAPIASLNEAFAKVAAGLVSLMAAFLVRSPRFTIVCVIAAGLLAILAMRDAL